MYKGDKNAEISKGKVVTTAFNSLATFLATFMWRRPLNSVVSTTTTHREPRKIPDGTGTRVKAGMADKCAIKMV